MNIAQTPFQQGLDWLQTGNVSAAVRAFEAAVDAAPEDADARYYLANAYRDLFRLKDAEREMRKVVAQRPTHAKSYSALGIILAEAGRPGEAVAVYEAAMAIDPAYVNAATNWVNTQQYLSGVTEERLAHSHSRWAALHAAETPTSDFPTERPTDRPLVVGFVSPDLAKHPVGLLSVRLFENLDHAAIRPIVFSTRPTPYEDEISRRIARTAKWVTVFGMNDDVIAALIRASKVDILFDLSGHTAHHSLKLFARRAAPVQISWLGYTGTTGIPAMDYVLANAQLTPPGTDAFYNERILGLARTHACFDPPPDAPAVSPAPFASNGFVTFGCLNNPVKISRETLASFARILTRVPNSRLKLRYKSMGASDVEARLRSVLAAHGIAPARVDVAGHVPGVQFLGTYNEIDIALDTSPYSGCFTTCEALWMGCPVVAFPGATFAGRQSASILTAAGQTDLIAKDRAGYEDLAVALAGDHDRIARLRAYLREHVAASYLCNGPAFAQDFTQTLQTAWTQSLR